MSNSVVICNNLSIPEGSAHGLIVHVRLVLVFAPEFGHGLRVDQLEDALLPLCPLNVFGAGVPILQKVQQKLPQVGAVYKHTETYTKIIF